MKTTEGVHINGRDGVLYELREVDAQIDELQAKRQSLQVALGVIESDGNTLENVPPDGLVRLAASTPIGHRVLEEQVAALHPMIAGFQFYGSRRDFKHIYEQIAPVLHLLDYIDTGQSAKHAARRTQDRVRLVAALERFAREFQPKPLAMMPQDQVLKDAHVAVIERMHRPSPLVGDTVYLWWQADTGKAVLKEDGAISGVAYNTLTEAVDAAMDNFARQRI